MDRRIEAAQRALATVTKERALDKAKHQNENQRLRADYQKKRERCLAHVERLARQKKQQLTEMSTYRDAIEKVFASDYVPAFCLAKQAFLLRAMHSSKCDWSPKDPVGLAQQILTVNTFHATS